MDEKIIFFDTTLRDGDQASGFHFLRSEKIEMAKQLVKLGVDVIEAGFAASSEGDFKSVNEIAKIVGNEDVTICSLARAIDRDIEIAAKALEPARKKRIHTFIATSDVHVQEKYGKDKKWIIEKAVSAVRKARSFVDDVQFSCEDFGRTDLDYTVEIVKEAIRAGAGTINLPDTVGFLTPDEAYQRVKYVINKIREMGLDAVFSVHNHDDLGLATANTLQGVRAGARQVEATINGIGERAGNTSLEEVSAILHLREIDGKRFENNIKNELIFETSKLCSGFTGIEPQPNKAIVGKNAFAHEAGIHQDGMIKNRNTYEVLDPKNFGLESKHTFGPRSGRNALRTKFKELGHEFPDESFEEIFQKFKELGDGKKEINDEDLLFLISSYK